MGGRGGGTRVVLCSGMAGLGRVSRVDVLGLERKPIYSWW